MPMNCVAQELLALPRLAKRLIALSVDAALCFITVWLAFGLRLDEWDALTGSQWLPVGAALALALPLFTITGLYRAIFRYSGWAAMQAVVKAMIVYAMLFATAFSVYGINDVPHTIGVIQPILLFMAVIGSRVAARYWLSGMYQRRVKQQLIPKALIYGAGEAGRQLVGVLTNSRELAPIGFVDDKASLQGGTINGLRIYHPSSLADIVHRLGVTDVLLAIPSSSRIRRNEILTELQPLLLRVRTLPSLLDLAHGRVHAADIRELDIEDLLGRDPVAPNDILLNRNIRNKVVLVTGAGGSIGSELCRQILKASPSTLLLVERSEFALYAVHRDLLAAQPDDTELTPRIIPLLASVRDYARMEEIMRTWHPHTVYHAAAYKHVPLVEHNPADGIRNNVFGTLLTAKAAAENGVNNFVLVSTDKAVRPTNIMGASKRLAEMVLQGLASASEEHGYTTKFSMVRFGNVLGSSGSVVPLFRQQIKDGGPITLTHADVTRYFMTIPESAELVIQAAAMSAGGDVFVLDMGEPVRILDLAHRMIKLSGLTVKDADHPDGDIEVVVTGLRPGEKLYEELLIGDSPEPSQHPRIMKAHDDCLPWAQLKGKLTALEAALELNDVRIFRQMLKELVAGYRPTGDIVDWVHLEQEAEVVAKEWVADGAA